MPSDGARYAIGDLAGLAGATPRTIRYYVAQGLLPPPVGVGPGAHYTDDHLARLRLIRRLQRQHQPLAEIRQRLDVLGEEDVAALLADDAGVGQVPPGDSALEYVRSVLAGRESGPAPGSTPTPVQSRPAQPAPASPAVAAAAPAAPPLGADAVPSPRAGGSPGLPRFTLRRAMTARHAPAPPPHLPEAAAASVADELPAATGAAASPSSEQRSQWDRIGLTPNIEIHVRRPLSRLENRRVERLITIARQLLREEQP